MKLDLDDTRWPYQFLADTLRQAIEQGQYREGDRLPSRRELIEAYDMHGATVAHAISQLEDAGLVVAKHGVGVFVRRAPAGSRWARALVDWVSEDRACFELGLTLGVLPAAATIDDLPRSKHRHPLAVVVDAMVTAGLLEREEGRYRTVLEGQSPGQMAIPVT